MPNLLLYGDTERSAALRHEIPIAIGDPFLYAEVDGRAAILTSSLERERIAAVRPDADLIDWSDLGFHELLESGMSREDMVLELLSRAIDRIGITEAVVDPEFPIAVADRFRAKGLTLMPDHDAVASRRRAKSDAEMAGIR